MLEFSVILWSCAVALLLPTFVTTTKTADATPNITSLSEKDTGFHINNKANAVDIYWLPVRPEFENGVKFEYKICEMMLNHTGNCKTSKCTPISFKYNKTKSYKFEIKGQNNVGESDKKVTVNMPPFFNLFQKPIKLYKIRENNVHTVAWSFPKNNEAAHSYTVYICVANNDLTQHDQCNCTVRMAMHHVNSNITSFSHKHSYELNFAVSANSLTSSSEMVWAMCSPGKSIGKLEKDNIYPVQTGKTQAKISWTPSCPDDAIVESYKLKICFSNSSLDCQEKSTNLNDFTFTELIPYKDYQIEIAMIFNGSIGEYSSPVFFKTAEAGMLNEILFLF
jgi:hypothetical protein